MKDTGPDSLGPVFLLWTYFLQAFMILLRRLIHRECNGTGVADS